MPLDLRAPLILLLAAQGGSQPGDPAPQLCFSSDFERPDALADWAEIDGATAGEGPASTVTLDGGALCFTVAPDARRWRALTRSVDLGGASWLRVSARMRTEGVDRAAARFANCNLFVRFSTGGIAVTQVLDGTQDWTTVARRLSVPSGARSATIGCFLSMPGRAWFDDVRVESVPAPAWSEKDAGALVLHWLPGDAISADALAYSLESLRLTREFLGVEAGAPIHYFKYPDRATKLELTGDGGNAFAEAEARRVHTLWERDRHELVHVLAHQLGTPPALLGEGLAVHLSGAWQQQPVRDYARGVRDDGRWIPLAELVDTRAFQRHSDLVTYAEAGAFVGWVVKEHGRETLLALYRTLDNRAPVEKNRKALEDGLGAPLDELDRALRESL